ncbi:hypothetical protein HYU50_04220 [Candidatus Woesearchaeota archaeon]|nr:hypothetical protein [Candidatus Woesearchaeota archaeon]
METGIIRKIVLWMVILLVLPAHILAAGGGGGGSSSSGLGFGSRDSVYILVNQDYSEKFSLKNSTKYELKIDVVNETINVNFGDISIKLAEGDNFVDLNNNSLADINFNLISTKGKVANIRIIDAKELVSIAGNSEADANKTEEKNDKETKKDEEPEGLECSNLTTLKERVACRIGMEKEEQEKELKLYYLPEECRALAGNEKGICIARYKSVQTCWKFPIGDERVSCVKRFMNLGTIQEEKEVCNKLTGEEKSVCVREIKNKVYNLIKWRFYDLEERAEDFMHRGLADKETVAAFIEKTELNKAKFNEAKTKEERKDVILAVKNDWKDFVGKVKENFRG